MVDPPGKTPEADVKETPFGKIKATLLVLPKLMEVGYAVFISAERPPWASTVRFEDIGKSTDAPTRL